MIRNIYQEKQSGAETIQVIPTAQSKAPVASSEPSPLNSQTVQETSSESQPASESFPTDFYTKIPSTPPSACATCITSLDVVLLHYSALGSEDSKSLKTLAPELPTALTGDLLPTLTSARYAVRFLHQGYIYIVTNRGISGGWGLDACLQVDNEERVKNFYPQNVNIRDTVTANSYGTAVNIRFPMDIVECRVLYTLSELTAAQLNAMVTNAALRDKMQLFDIQALLAQPEKIHQHILPTATLNQYVAEIIAITPSMNALYQLDRSQQDNSARDRLIADSDLLSLLYSQYHQTPSSLNFNEHVWVSLSKHYKNRIPKNDTSPPPNKMSAAFVLLNPVGITQALNHWRNLAWVHFETDYLNRKRGRYTNASRLHIANSLIELEEQYPVFAECAAVSAEWRAYCEHRKAEEELKQTRDYCELIKDIGDSYDLALCRLPAGVSTVPKYKTPEDFEREIAANRQNMLSAWDALEAKIQSRERASEARNAEHRETFARRFKPLIDSAAIEREKTAYQDAWAAVKMMVQERYDDHNTWLFGLEFDRALSFYDQNDINSGLAFANDTGHCIIGLSGTEDGFSEIFRQFITRKDDEAEWSLALKAIAFNQTELLNHIDLLQKQLQDPGDGSDAILTPSAIDTASTIAQFMKPLLDLAESRAATHGGLYAWVHQLQMAVLGNEALRTADKGMRKVLRALLIGQSLRGVDLLRDPLVTTLLGPSTPELRQQMNDMFTRHKESSAFSQVRLGGLMLVIEALNLITLLNKDDMSAEDISKCFGAAFSTLAATSELAASYLTYHIQHASRYTQFNTTQRLIVNGALQRIIVFKFAGASLALVGTTLAIIPETITDGKKLFESLTQKRWLLTTAYFVKLTANGLFMAGAGHEMFALLNPLFKRQAIAQNTPIYGELVVSKIIERWETRGLQIGGRLVAGLGTVTVFATTGWGLIVFTAISIMLPLIIDYFFPEDPVELEEWLKRSVYGVPPRDETTKTLSPYKDINETLTEYQKAIAHLLNGVPVTFYDVQYPREKQWIAENR